MSINILELEIKRNNFLKVLNSDLIDFKRTITKHLLKNIDTKILYDENEFIEYKKRNEKKIDNFLEDIKLRINETVNENLENFTVNCILNELEEKDKTRKNCEYVNKNGRPCKIKINLNQESCHVHKRYILENRLSIIQNKQK